MKFVKFVMMLIGLAMILSLVMALIGYTPVADREPNTYYSSILESLLFSMYYLTPMMVLPGILIYIVYRIISRFTKISHWPKVGLSVFIIAAIFGSILFIQHEKNQTDDLYLIPAGFEGDVFVFYNIKGAPKIKKEDGYDVHKINEKGYFVTSTADMDYGTVTDRYYYVDRQGKRTPIDKKCIRIFGTGGYSNSENEESEIIYTGLRVKKEPCSESFQTEEAVGRYERKEEVMREILQRYYGIEDNY